VRSNVGIVLATAGAALIAVGLRGASAARSLDQRAYSVPSPSVATLVPPGYRILKTYRANLSGGAVPDVIVTSATRSNKSPRGADLQVISWDAGAGRWKLSFDGRTARWMTNAMPGPGDSNSGPGYPYGSTFPGKPGPLLGTLPQLEVSVDKVAFAAIFGRDRNQLVFSGTYVAGGGMQGILAVVDVHNGAGKIVYVWEGDTGLGPWRISHNVIRAEANYMAPYDAECCPVRTYHFSLGAHAGRIVEMQDDRPFLGVVLRNTPSGYPSVGLTAPHSPAAGRLRVGDVILKVENAPSVRPLPGLRRAFEYSIFDSISSFHAGQTARLLIQRGAKRLTLSVKLGSLKDAAAAAIRTPTTDGSMNAL
jgi:hypothetical protein